MRITSSHKKTKEIRRGRISLRPLFIVACFVFFIASNGYCDLSYDLNRKGLSKMKEKNYREAIVYFESAHKADIDNRTIQKNLSTAYHYMANKDSASRAWIEAIRHEKLALRFDPNNDQINKQLSIYYNNYALEEADKGNFRLGVENLKYALKYSPKAMDIRKNLYYVTIKYARHLSKKKNSHKAIMQAKEATKLLPMEKEAYIFLGDLYYKNDRFIDSLKYWNKALKIDPNNKDLLERVEKLKREKIVEGDFDTKKKRFFKIRYDKELKPEYVKAISDILDDARALVRKEFSLTTTVTIPVIVYQAEEFHGATAQSHWTQGLYDGKIRIREQDISRTDKALRRILYHEYAHAILYLNFGNSIPAWLHEGFAQYNEPEFILSRADKRVLKTYLKDAKFNLNNLNSMFKEKENIDVIQRAYLESRLFFGYLIDKYGKYKMKRALKLIDTGSLWDEALKEVYHRNIKRFNSDFNEYLDEIL